jgi:hypothetical protein
MGRYRKKPVVIDAMQWDPSTKEGIADGLRFVKVGAGLLPGPDGQILTIKTLEGIMETQPGDWIIKGVKGEFYPCKPDIFEATYEEVT